MGASETGGGIYRGSDRKPEKKIVNSEREKSPERVFESAMRKSVPIFVVSTIALIVSAEELVRTNNHSLVYPLVGSTVTTLGSYIYMQAHRLKYGLSKAFDNAFNSRQ